MKGRVAIEETIKKKGEKVVLAGWIQSKRDHGQVVFLDLRDRSGVVQLVGGKELAEFGIEDVVRVEGKVVQRKPEFINPNLPTGEIEIQTEKVVLLSRAEPLPFEVKGEGRELAEEVRLKYRYLDLRRPRLRNNLFLRHRLLQFFRQELTRRGFWEVETPYLSKSTPEGARDFLVPSRLQPGKFYALPQSPQQYKQLLMVAGIEKYFQLARCFRDEDLRADRQFEFVQVDVEMSFVSRDEVIEEIEAILIAVMEKAGKKIFKKPFPRFSYQEVKKRFGDDKFDLRKKKEKDVLAFAWVVDFPLFEKTETRELSPAHHPFTAPNPEDIPLLEKQPLKVRSWQYDLVCNGFEVGGGSIRITDPEIQKKVFRILGHSPKEIKEKFGHLLESFKYGVPPHGGIALGFDRLVMLAAGEESVREVTAFPCSARGKTAVMDAPSEVSPDQLRELGLKIIPPRKK